MENRMIFREMLSEIKNAADASGGVITRGEVREILKDMPLEEEHFQLIYDYLAQQNIQVADSREEAREAQELEEQAEHRSLSLYLEELEELEGAAFEDEQELFGRIVNGDIQARNRLVESYLPTICQMAGDYEGSELPSEDLIQEGNLGLMTALDALDQFDSPAACRAHILNTVNAAMEQAIRDSQDTRKMGEGIVSRVNHLNEAVKNLEEDLEHKVSAEELSAYLEMPLDEIRDLLRMSGDQIEIENT